MEKDFHMFQAITKCFLNCHVFSEPAGECIICLTRYFTEAPLCTSLDLLCWLVIFSNLEFHIIIRKQGTDLTQGLLGQHDYLPIPNTSSDWFKYLCRQLLQPEKSIFMLNMVSAFNLLMAITYYTRHTNGDLSLLVSIFEFSLLFLAVLFSILGLS